jgi:hypothetical protein
MYDIRAAQTGVFDLDIRISYRLFIDVCKSFAVRNEARGLDGEMEREREQEAGEGPEAVSL